MQHIIWFTIDCALPQALYMYVKSREGNYYQDYKYGHAHKYSERLNISHMAGLCEWLAFLTHGYVDFSLDSSKYLWHQKPIFVCNCNRCLGAFDFLSAILNTKYRIVKWRVVIGTSMLTYGALKQERNVGFHVRKERGITVIFIVFHLLLVGAWHDWVVGWKLT